MSHRREIDRKMSPVQHFAFGTVRPGWTRSEMIDWLRGLAAECSAYQVDQAERYRRWVVALEKPNGGPTED